METPSGAAAPPQLRGLGRCPGRIPGQRTGIGSGCREGLGPGAADTSRLCWAEQGPEPGVDNSCWGGAAAHWLLLLSPGGSIEQMRAGRTMRERALQTPITPQLMNVFLNKHYGSASNGAEAAAEVPRGRRRNSLSWGDGVGRIPKQEWGGKTIARSERSWGKAGALCSAQHGDCAPPASRRAADQ